MIVSVLDLFKIGIGPSSSHTVGPMKAAYRFVKQLTDQNQLSQVQEIIITLYGSLASTGRGHATDKALIFGLAGFSPENITWEDRETIESQLKNHGYLLLNGLHNIAFDPKKHLNFKHIRPLALHPNGMHCQALDAHQTIIAEEVFYSTGGGFISTEEEMRQNHKEISENQPYPIHWAKDLMSISAQTGKSIADIALANEIIFRPEHETIQALQRVWETMQDCVKRGIATQGILPGGLKVERRASLLYQQLLQNPEKSLTDPLTILDWINLYALAVNEENAASGRVVTAPTNGAAGIIPAVLHYATRFRESRDPLAPVRFLLTAGAIGMLYKKNASISGAEAGCQGEVGVACSMAAAGLVEYLGGTPAQVENAAEIGMEHNLGLTCDPIGGLVQIPCIERNAMASVKAVNAARIAMCGEGKHHVSLDKVIRTMRQTGLDMKSKYKETSRGGLAVNWTEC